jgi:ABC-2 type transport system permease protein
MLLFGSIWGNDPFPGETFGYIDAFTSSFIGIVILTAATMNLTINLSTYREKGILKRFRATPVSPVSFLAGEFLAILAISLLGVFLLLIAGVVLFNMHFRGNILEGVAAFLISSFGIAGLGFIPASLARSARSGTVISNSLYFPMLFLSGAALPRQMLPGFLKTASEILPLTHAIRMMQGIWLGESLWNFKVEIAVLGGILLAGTFVATRLFRWD